MKLNIRFESQEDYKLFVSLLGRIFKTVKSSKNLIGRNNYEFTLLDPIKVGRPKVEITNTQIKQILTLYQQGKSINSISTELHISRRQIYRVIEKYNMEGEHE